MTVDVTLAQTSLWVNGKKDGISARLTSARFFVAVLNILRHLS
jgi:hypothetical protein